MKNNYKIYIIYKIYKIASSIFILLPLWVQSTVYSHIELKIVQNAFQWVKFNSLCMCMCVDVGGGGIESKAKKKKIWENWDYGENFIQGAEKFVRITEVFELQIFG